MPAASIAGATANNSGALLLTTLLNNLGLAYSDLVDAKGAIEVFERSLGIARELGDRGGEAAALHNLGLAYIDQGNTRQDFYQDQRRRLLGLAVLVLPQEAKTDGDYQSSSS